MLIRKIRSALEHTRAVIRERIQATEERERQREALKVNWKHQLDVTQRRCVASLMSEITTNTVLTPESKAQAARVLAECRRSFIYIDDGDEKEDEDRGVSDKLEQVKEKFEAHCRQALRSHSFGGGWDSMGGDK